MTAPIEGLTRLWKETRGDARICVAILDGPVDLSHPALTGADLTLIETLVRGEADGGPAARHGTHVASVIFGRHGSSVSGIAPGCRGLVLPVFTDGRDGALAPCSQIDLARAITQAVELGAHVINVSGGQLAPQGEGHQLLAKAVELCALRGVLIVAAAGNDGCACLHVPAALPSVLAVGAMDEEGSPLGFSNWGETYLRQGVLAPGAGIPGAVPGGGVEARSGTSFATPLVSGAAALLLSRELARHRPAAPLAVRDAILGSAEGCAARPISDCRRLLVGRLNLPGAAALLDKGAPMESTELAPAQGNGTANPLPSSLVPAVLPAAEPPAGISASCCGGGQPPAKAYVLGQIGYDFGTEARRDSFVQAGVAAPGDPRALLAHLAEHPESATAVTWTLCQETTPIYAVQPAGPFAAETYRRLAEFFAAQLDSGVERVSLPGLVAGKAHLLNGQTVPILWPELRGMYSWSTAALVSAVLGKPPADGEGRDAYEARTEDVGNFLDRIYYEVRNLGLSSPERALNFAATNAFQADQVFRSAIAAQLKLSSITVERSPICRPESDCWDVKLTFFQPLRRLEQAQEVYRFTIDVSDVVPVTVGRVRHWQVY